MGEEEECRRSPSLRLGIVPSPGLRIDVGEEEECRPFLSLSPIVGEEEEPLISVGEGDTKERGPAGFTVMGEEDELCGVTMGVLRRGDGAPVGTWSPLLATQITVYTQKSEMGIKKWSFRRR
jgi:hypothetical protein